MRAVICTKYGPPEVLKIVEIEKPIPKDNEVLIKVLATTVTSADSRIRSFRVPVSFWLPARMALGFTRPKRAVLGSELAGEIESVGKDVKLFRKNDPVIGYLGHDLFGAYAEYVCMDEKGCLTLRPPNLTFEQAAALPFGGITALHFLKKAEVHKGQNVLIYGASGDVGTYAVQLAKFFGAEVTAVTSTANLGMLKELGADRVIDYTEEDFSENAGVYDVIVDAVGKIKVSRSLKALKKDGTYVNVVAAPATMLQMRWASLTGKHKLIGGTAVPKIEHLIFLKDLAASGKIKPVVDRVYPLEQIVEAHRYVDQGHKKGSVVIAPVCC